MKSIKELIAISAVAPFALIGMVMFLIFMIVALPFIWALGVLSGENVTNEL
jgi:hypothetical protein